MTKQESIMCFKLFSMFFNGQKYGKVFQACRIVDRFSTVNDNIFELYLDEDSIRYCVGERYVMIWYDNKILIYNDRQRCIYKNTKDFLNYFKITFEDIV